MTRPADSTKTLPAGVASAWGGGVLRGLAISVGVGVIFAWLGVYGTNDIPFPERVAYWTGLIILGWVSASIVNPLVFDRWMRSAHTTVQIGVVACVISIPITVGLIIIEYMSDGTLAEPAWWWIQFGYVVVISLLLTAAGWAVDRLTRQQAATAQGQPGAAVAAAAASAFTDRLPAKFRATEIYAVSAEDHYLRVHTSAGETMILMRLADAIRELRSLEGLQTHRSWWVARQGLAEVSKGDGKVTLRLKSGVEAPVSRANLKTVKDAGWL